MEELRVVVTAAEDGRREGVEELRGWLLDVPELRGRIRRDDLAASRPGTMGAASDALIALLAPGGVATVFAGAVIAWVQTRRGNHTITVTRSDGTEITISSSRARDISPQEAADLAQRLAAPPSEEPPPSPPRAVND
ncbi:hypothetical protein [Streptomyces sp. NPDC057375]|uniref:effector-associated constant component EACC1 n=1 Tax=Streptomyces sp. NPDC057375 TaxID=3346109 RepID=UPI003633027C